MKFFTKKKKETLTAETEIGCESSKLASAAAAGSNSSIGSGGGPSPRSGVGAKSRSLGLGLCEPRPQYPSQTPSTVVSRPTADINSTAKSPAAEPKPQAMPTADITPTSLTSSSSATQEKTPVNFILNLTDNKPLDTSDISDLSTAKQEIQRIRQLAMEFLDSIGENINQKVKDEHVDPRFAMYDKQDFASFRKVSYVKTDVIRSLIYEAIKPNELFEHDTKEEILQIIDVFKPQTFCKGERVIQQGDEGSEFYVVESGQLSFHSTFEGEDGTQSKVKLGDYSAGATFGDLALIFGSPWAATITAETDCKLWSIERVTYRSVIQQLRYEKHAEKKKFLGTCVVSGRQFMEIFNGSQIEDLTIATKVDTYQEGEVILREGEMGDTFYIVASGSVQTFDKGEKTKVIKEKAVFGTTSLLKGVVSPFTYKAASHVTLYYLTRHDFESIMGSFQDALDGNTVSRPSIKLEASVSTNQRYKFGLGDLDFFNVLGRGAFGQVTLVQEKKTKKLFALKAQSKHTIIKKNQKEHVLNEYRIMMDIEHPNMLNIHCAMQDKQHLYFLLDLLPGGELMTYLVKRTRMGGGFTEDVTRFYAASVVLAFEQLHAYEIAYRDLKPENIVLNKKGYGVVVDFGLAKEIDEGQTYTFCGTPDYLAPEIIRGTGHDWAVDYWGLGVFLFEMTNGTAPFYATTQQRRTRKIMKGFEFVKVPSNFSGGLTDLILNLLMNDQSKRLGRTQNGVQGIMNHWWFDGFDWEGFKEQSIKAPIEPSIPVDIKTIGKKKVEGATHVPASDWWPDLENLEQW